MVGTAHPTAPESRPAVVVVVGAAGTPEYAAQFTAWAKLWEQACAKSGATFTAIGLDEPGDASDLTRIQQILTSHSEETTAALWLVLIGHGTFDGRTPKFNLRGPDLAAKDLAEWLKPVRRPLAVIDATSSSAPFLKELSSPGRTHCHGYQEWLRTELRALRPVLRRGDRRSESGPRQGRPDLPARSLPQRLPRGRAVLRRRRPAGHRARPARRQRRRPGHPCRVVPRHPPGPEGPGRRFAGWLPRPAASSAPQCERSRHARRDAGQARPA